MDTDFREIINKRVVLFDGGMGSMLIAAGLGEGEIPEQWNLERPDRIIAIHAAYLQAGAEVIQTNTFGATGLKLGASAAGKKLDPAGVNEAAARLVREALEGEGAEDRFVAGDMGPCGELFSPMGRLTPAMARDTFREQARALERGGVDLFLIETMYDLREAVEALRAVREVSDKPAVVELTFDLKSRGYFTLVGDTPRKAAAVLEAEGADMIGANCTLTSDKMIGLVSEFRDNTGLPLLFQPNAGHPEMENGRAVYRQPPGDFAGDTARMIEAGANAVGGCCGTDPRFIRAIRDYLDGRK
ncbi:MAG: homocysteine S-methyltransferase family protein [Candidatus Krumholzibacteriota bacterium]|nr:homocysteine S-methyltransferase family protein [Candidatus Krumholzibacteriota bacterium]